MKIRRAVILATLAVLAPHAGRAATAVNPPAPTGSSATILPPYAGMPMTGSRDGGVECTWGGSARAERDGSAAATVDGHTAFDVAPCSGTGSRWATIPASYDLASDSDEVTFVAHFHVRRAEIFHSGTLRNGPLDPDPPGGAAVSLELAATTDRCDTSNRLTILDTDTTGPWGNADARTIPPVVEQDVNVELHCHIVGVPQVPATYRLAASVYASGRFTGDNGQVRASVDAVLTWIDVSVA